MTIKNGLLLACGLGLMGFATAGLSSAEEPAAAVSSSERPYSGEWFPLFKSIPDEGKEHVIAPGHITDTLCPKFQMFYPEGWKASDKRPVLVVFPGGGYGILAIEKEGTKIARWANELGMVAAVVKYRVTDQGSGKFTQFPGPLRDARQALRIIRRDAASMGADPAKIGVIGFSAGGHLASMMATIWDEKLSGETGDGLDAVPCRPDFAMLIYPVITLEDGAGHAGSRYKLFGSQVAPEVKARYSGDKRVTDKTPPLFLEQSKDDGVSCKNSELMELAAKAHGVDVTRVLYERGGHGYGMEIRNQPTDAWPKEAEKWLDSHGWTQCAK